jgi:PAS domain S-box-containing protein
MSAPTAFKRFLRANGLASPSRVAVLALVVAAGAGLTAWSYLTLRREAEATARLEARQAAHERVELLRSQVLRSLEILHSIVALFETSEEVKRDEFRRFVRPALARQPELQALEWIPRVPEELRTRFERAAESDGLEGFHFTEIGATGGIVPAGERREYFPVFYVEPVRGNAPALGLDLAADARRRVALERAAGDGAPAATGPIRLAQGNAGDRAGFLVFAPVRTADGALMGFGLAVFRVSGLVDAALAPLAARGLRVEVRDEAEPGAAIYTNGGSAPTSGLAAWRHEETLTLAGRTWRLTFTPGAAFPGGRPGWALWAAPLGIATAAVLLAAYLLSSMRRTAEIEEKVTEKTAELSREVVVRQRAEEAMREAEAKFRSIFENAVNGIFQSTLDGRYISANPALARIYGYASPEELLASFSDIGRQLYVEPQRREEFVRAVRDQGTVEDFVSQVRRRDGRVIWISEKALAVRGPAGEALFFEGIVEDVTERIRTADALRRANEALEERVAERTGQLAAANAALQAEVAVRTRAEASAEAANRAKSLFLADMSHEIRTPLNAILGYTQLLQRDARLGPEHAEAVRAIVEGGNHLLCLVDGVLDLTKIEVGRMELAPVDFDLAVLAKGMAAMFTQRCQQKGLRLRVENPGTAPVWLHGDERKLRQVLVNLLSNAVKFTDRGEIRLRVVPAAEPNAYRFEVIDTGAGIPAEAQARIFEPFKQDAGGREKGGTGLGLSIARRLIELMGGRLDVKSSAGWGSNFFFILRFDPPRTVVPPLVEGGAATLRLAAGCRVRALVIDDLKTNRDVLGRMLHALGCEVWTAESGEEALHLARSTAIDIVFVDIRMPGMDGVETLRALRKEFGEAGVKYVSYSATAFEHEREKWRAAGFDEALPKPFRFERIGECLASLLPVSFAERASGTGDAPVAIDWGALGLPAELVARLRAAAEIGDFGGLRKMLLELENRGASAGELARRLRHCAERFDAEAALALLARASEKAGAGKATAAT